MSFIKTELCGSTAIISLDRPDALNAISTQLLSELDAALTEAETNSAICVIILTGAGKAFAAGADIGEMASLSPMEGQKFAKRGGELFLRLENLSKPVIAAVNGYALGGGCELSMACDIRLASENAKFGQPETAIGVIPGFGGTQRLPRIVGMSRAMELIFTSTTISAQEAMDIGLVSRVYPAEQLMDEAKKLAMRIAEQGQLAVRQAKLCMRQGIQADITTAVALEAEAFGLVFSTDDRREGMSAFLEKRRDKRFRCK